MRRSKDTKLTPIGHILRDILPGLEPNPAERARARVAAILDQWAAQSEVERSIRALKQDEMFDDPFEDEVTA